jgi:hypothetical protein
MLDEAAQEKTDDAKITLVRDLIGIRMFKFMLYSKK